MSYEVHKAPPVLRYVGCDGFGNFEGDSILICPECKKLGQESIVRFQTEMLNSAAADVYYDGKGQLHIHAPELYKSVCKCSEGHEFINFQSTHCPSCDFRSDQLPVNKVVIGAV